MAFPTIPIIGALGKVVGKVFDRVFPDRTAANKAQTDINVEEVKGAPVSRLRLWRSFLGWVLVLLLFWEMVCRTVILTYWPEAKIPESMLEPVFKLLMAMLGFA